MADVDELVILAHIRDACSMQVLTVMVQGKAFAVGHVVVDLIEMQDDREFCLGLNEHSSSRSVAAHKTFLPKALNKIFDLSLYWLVHCTFRFVCKHLVKPLGLPFPSSHPNMR